MRSRNETGRERQHLDWKRAPTEPGHLLAGIDDHDHSLGRRRDDFLAQHGAALALDRSQLRIELVGAVDGQIELCQCVEGQHRQAGRFRGVAGGERRGDGRHLQARRYPFPERGDGEVRRRAGAKADQHPVLDLGDGGRKRPRVCKRRSRPGTVRKLPRRLLHSAQLTPTIICMGSVSCAFSCAKCDRFLAQGSVSIANLQPFSPALRWPLRSGIARSVQAVGLAPCPFDAAHGEVPANDEPDIA